jgi:hypothetical protein
MGGGCEVATQAASQAPTTEQFRGAFHKELDALVEQVRDMGAGTRQGGGNVWADAGLALVPEGR